MLRTRCAAVIGSVVLVLATAGTAAATPATPVISAVQTTTLAMRLTSSTGTHWSWTIVNAAGAVVASAATNPVNYTFPAAGDYTARLDATDDDPVATAPAHAEATFHVYARPTAGFTSTQLADGTVQLTDASTGVPTAWVWTLPGNVIYRTQAVPAVRLPAGTNNVTLRVTNPGGNNAITKQVVVNGPPVPALNIMSTPAAIGAPVLLDASRSTDPNQDPLTYAWDLDGDGVFSEGTGALQTVSYALAGQYRVAVQVSDGHGGVSVAQGAITVLVDQAPVVFFSNDPAVPAADGPIQFAATASDQDGSVTRIEWDLDDDGAFDDAAGPRATWSFATPGPHRVAVKATDDRGVGTVSFRTVQVGPKPADQVQEAPAGPSTQSSASGPAIPNGPASSSTRATLLAPFPIVRIRGAIYRGSVRITLLKVQAPAGATIRVRCRNGSCAGKKVDLRLAATRDSVRVRVFDGRRLRPGTVVEVRVTAPRRIGKYMRFTVRRNAAPARTDSCLRPGRTVPVRCPTS
jgi:PKD repeat protein